jgi:tellurite resistance protein TehA-like permease
MSVYRSTHAVKPFTTIAIVIFSLVAVLHVLRLIFGWEVVINGLVMPMWASVVGTIVAGGLTVMVWRESRQGKH